MGSSSERPPLLRFPISWSTNVSPALSCSQSGNPSRSRALPAEIVALGVNSVRPSLALSPSEELTKIMRLSPLGARTVHPSDDVGSWGGGGPAGGLLVPPPPPPPPEPPQAVQTIGANRRTTTVSGPRTPRRKSVLIQHRPFVMGLHP